MTEISKQRDGCIDAAKGIGIVLVVLGHCIQYCGPKDFDDSYLFKFIYAFHMPFFFFLSGYIAFFSFDGTLKKLKRRATGLLVPFFFWAVFSWLRATIPVLLSGKSNKVDFGFFEKLLLDPGIGLWFLWVLFLCFLLLFIFNKTKLDSMVMVMILALILLIQFVLPTPPVFGFSLLRNHFIYFASGYLFAKHRQGLIEKMPVTFTYVCVILYPVMVVFWNRVELSPLTAYLPFKSVMVLNFLFKMSTEMVVFNILFKLITAYVGIAAAMLVVKFLAKIDYMAKLLEYLGRKSLEIYAVHYQFFIVGMIAISSMDHRNMTTISIGFFSIFPVSLIAVYLINKYTPLSMMAFGR